ncbi:uncharacterized protein LOC131689510 isoform X2 [Topomyia yanbarensis]|uniref:uncharacterized protein LOC131689510 isoform X2 n=1 Tax=Topomyia yanbarensis TaxID=2498891 RepID=UPI00273CF0C9|nr:uncharacterized protein LOC131689510 isoform X2 [Topomyia yanbarensis]XP_058830653.1 uncharacterized protein LOC131689510 isoform X2 [Topomyia yanbarensis]XP_058830663.1 uncharacterized protein LOC131689510 isoform X2 [Topomyia yanbarensis]XP_058830674.1 uncharacterized protein LOC131689510 isoform X2 [Topomyia yanbarensis]XP_058830685.1 uncharacterized protein LOC131689510 isoform X2 [Topomyia yanbarensis]
MKWNILVPVVVVVVAASLILECDAARKLKGSTDVDTLRHRYLELESRAWTIVNQIDKVENQKDEDRVLQRNIVLKELIGIYSGFANDELGPDNTYDEDDYFILKRFYEWQLLEQDLINVHKLFDALRQYMKNKNQLPADDADLELASTDLADTVLSDPHFPVNSTLEQIDTIMIRQGLFYKAQLEAKSTICSFGLSAQQVLYQLYNAISITELKGYSMMQFSWMLLKAYGKGNFTTEAKLMRRRFEDRTSRTQTLLQRVMQQASREYWRCDPERNQQKEGETFLQLTRLLQGYVENEVDMNTDNTCKENCAHYSWGVKQEQCYKDLYCSKQPKCSGKIYDCEYMDSDMWICPAASSSDRRYEYIEYENGMILGQKKHCSRGTTKVDSWWRWLFWHCSYCFCLCDDAGPRSDRYINMKESVSDVMNNKVVTGMRFVKKNRIIHLVVQQGTLLPRGQIDNTTLDWVEAESYNILSPNVRNGRDYHTLGHDNRILDLDDLEVQPSYVLTGVRFRLLGTHLNMEIRMTEMDFGTGKLMDPDKSIWIGSDKTEHSEDKRTELKLDRPHVPLLTPAKSIPDSISNQFIRFRESDRGMDAAQTTVPFFDAQPVVPTKPVPLAGAGLFHKGRPKFGGFVAPKVLTYDFGPHVQAPIEQVDADERQQRG